MRKLGLVVLLLASVAFADILLKNGSTIVGPVKILSMGAGLVAWRDGGVGIIYNSSADSGSSGFAGYYNGSVIFDGGLALSFGPLTSDAGITLVGSAASVSIGGGGLSTDGGIVLVGAPLAVGFGGMSTDGGIIINGNVVSTVGVFVLDGGVRVRMATAGATAGEYITLENTRQYANGAAIHWQNDPVGTTTNEWAIQKGSAGASQNLQVLMGSSPIISFLAATGINVPGACTCGGTSSFNALTTSGALTGATVSSTGTLTASAGFNAAGIITVSSFTDDSANTGNRTVSKTRGKSAFAGGTGSITITNTVVGAATADIACHLQTLDATCTSVVCIPSAGSFVATTNANCTGATKLSWEVHN